MEAHKEKTEQLEKEEEIRREVGKNSNKDGSSTSNKMETDQGDTVTKRLIRECIVPAGEGNDSDKKAQAPHDVLAFSRSVDKVDSSLE